MPDVDADGDAFTYAWQARSGDFLHWMLPVLLSGMPEATMEELAVATDKWQNVTLAIQVNGVSVPVASFLDGIERNMSYFAEQEARRLLDEGARFDELTDLIHDVERTVTTLVRARLDAAGVSIAGDDDDD